MHNYIVSVSLLAEVVDAHDLVPARVDDLDGDALVFARWKRQGGRAAETLKTLLINDAFEGAGDFAPGFLVGKEGLGDAEGPVVVVGINEPRRHLIAPFGGHHVIDGIVDIDALHHHEILTFLRRIKFGAGLSEHGES